MGTYTFDPSNPKEIADVKAFIANFEARSLSVTQDTTSELPDNGNVRGSDGFAEGIGLQEIQALLDTESGRLIYGGAAQMYLPNDRFSLEELADKIDEKPAHVLAWWRRLGATHARVGCELFTRHGGRPNLYSLAPAVHEAICREMSRNSK